MKTTLQVSTVNIDTLHHVRGERMRVHYFHSGEKGSNRFQVLWQKLFWANRETLILVFNQSKCNQYFYIIAKAGQSLLQKRQRLICHHTEGVDVWCLTVVPRA